MTVIRRPQQPVRCPNSNNASDTESLQLGGSVSASDTESINNDRRGNPRGRPAVVRPPLEALAKRIEELIKINKATGKKKLRRYNNRSELQPLSEEDENEVPVVIMEPYKSPFNRLLENPRALEYWNKFVEQSEEDQERIIKNLTPKQGCDKCNNMIKAEKPFARVSSKIRRTIKIKKNLSQEFVKASEEEVINFFTDAPNDIFTKVPNTSFERLLTHAIAQYHCLHSLGTWIDDKRSVVIHNNNENWRPSDCFLYDFISQLNSQKE